MAQLYSFGYNHCCQILRYGLMLSGEGMLLVACDIGLKGFTSTGTQHGKSALIEYQREYRSLTIILPLLPWAALYRSSTIYGQWTRSLRLSPVISDDAPIWDLCWNGDIVGMRRLFEAGLASPYDLSLSGVSPLHVGVLVLND
jgi:hypothetical protein